MNDSKNFLMDRHLKRVERWLKRCVAACKCGSWSDALAEAECLEAETKGLREKLWSAACDDVLRIPDRGLLYSVFAALKIAVLAMTMVLSAVVPLSIESESGILDFASQGDVVLLSSTESDIINALRESLSSGNTGNVVISIEKPEEVAAAEPDSGAAMAAERIRPVPKTSENTVAVVVEYPRTPIEKEAKTVRRPSADEVISLIQVGQRALRSSEPGVIVVQ